MRFPIGPPRKNDVPCASGVTGPSVVGGLQSLKYSKTLNSMASSRFCNVGPASDGPNYLIIRDLARDASNLRAVASPALFTLMRARDLEGIVAKRLNDPYKAQVTWFKLMR